MVSTGEPIKVLIGIVTYNHRKYIAQCMDSVAASAKHNSLKVVLVDNCSSDGSAEIVGDRYSLG
jgi:glycosyltransferase involved in cell wall biosynthesis